jgi:hypothetical protein
VPEVRLEVARARHDAARVLRVDDLVDAVVAEDDRGSEDSGDQRVTRRDRRTSRRTPRPSLKLISGS